MSTKHSGVNDHLTTPQIIEKLVRRKNSVYRKWRKQYKFPTLDDWCAECLMAFDQLPRWEEYIRARRTSNFTICDAIEIEHREWKNQVRGWCLKRRVTTYPNQSAQFLKFYFAWYRYHWEQRNGKIERQYARQMQ